MASLVIGVVGGTLPGTARNDDSQLARDGDSAPLVLVPLGAPQGVPLLRCLQREVAREARGPARGRHRRVLPVALRLQVVLRSKNEHEAEAVILFTGDDADLAAAAVAAWLSEDLLDLIDVKLGPDDQRPNLN